MEYISKKSCSIWTVCPCSCYCCSCCFCWSCCFSVCVFVRGIYCPIRSFFPPPLFWDHFFSPTNKFAAGGAKPRPTAGGVQGGSEDPPAKIFGVYDPKRCIFKAFFPVFLCNFRRISMRQGGEGGVGRPPAKIFEVYNPKRCIFKAFFPFFSSLFLSLFYFFSLTLQFHFFSPASHFSPPPLP